MPDGKTHDKITIFLTPILFGITYYIIKDIKTTLILMSAYLFASFMFNGDLDTVSKPYNRWWLFKMIWIPYQLMFTHRSIWTHGIIIGTVIRLIYICIIPLFIIYLHHDLNIIFTLNKEILIPILIGLELGSAIHTIADKIY